MNASIDLAAPEVHNDLGAFARSALSGDPVVWSDTHRAWLVLSHEEVVAGFRDPLLSSDRSDVFERMAERQPDAFARSAELLAGWMVFRDPPAHTRLRDPVWRAFTARSLDTLRGAIERAVDGLLDEMEAQPSVELGRALAHPLPTLVIADLLGVSIKARRRFDAWSRQLSSIVFSVSQDTIQREAVIEATAEFERFFTDELERRRARPTDDLLSLLANGEGVDDLTPLELVGACTLLLFAGHETTTGLMKNAVRVLEDHPAEITRLRRGEVDATAADELLRLVGPAKLMVRIAAQTHERAGKTIEAGDKVFLVIFTANRDPDVFDAPERLDLGRSPNPHVGFGWGPHHCLGANLARLEATIALRRLYQRFPDLALIDRPPWAGGALGLALPALRVSVG